MILIDESKNREKLKFTEIQKLSKDVEFKSKELWIGELQFYRYRMDKILKEYANFPLNKKIHALFEHGILYTDLCYGVYRAHEYVPSIVASKYRVSVLEKQKYYSGAYAIGPYIHYAKSLLSKEELKTEKERLGKTLLVFPSHSIEGLVSKFKLESFLDEIDRIANDFDSVRICMYYKDVTLNRFKEYQKRGYEVVTAGHYYDYNFLPRLRSIIETSDSTMSNGMGSHLGYCIYLNKPFYLYNPNEVKHVGEKNGENVEGMIHNEKIFEESKENNINIIKMINEFSTYDTKINKSQYQLISYLWGFDEVKTPSELQDLFLELENNFSYIKYYLAGLIRLKNLLKEKL